MHQVQIKANGEARDLLLPNGVHPLGAPEASCHALVLLSGAAAVVHASQYTRLYPGRELGVGPATRILWSPRPKAPAVMGRESTHPKAPRKSGGEPGFELQQADCARPLCNGDLILIGRHPGCTITHADSHISSFHCALLVRSDAVELVDLGSKNGTWVDGVCMREGLLTSSVQIRAGSLRLRLVSNGAARPRIPLPSPQMQRVHGLVERVARHPVPVLVTGESGVGKDHIASWLHERSGRAGRFVVLNAAQMSPQLAASELFGHERGAFTGADRQRDGAFLSADGGTLFLDEVGELALPVQAELLRAVESGAVRRVGSTREHRVDVRLVTATHRDLAAQVRAGRFREDLYHRLCVVPVELPPLRERPDDLEALANGCMAQLEPPRQLSRAALEKLRRYHWPGNIRQLLNVLQRSALLSDRRTLRPEDLHMPPSKAQGVGANEALITQLVIETYHDLGGSVAQTAAKLGLRRAAVYRHLRQARLLPRAAR